MSRCQAFPTLACRLIEAGEQTGNLDTICQVLADFYTRAEKDRRVFFEALAYPVFLLACLLLLMTGAVFFIHSRLCRHDGTDGRGCPQGDAVPPFGLRLAPPAWHLYPFGNKPDEFLPGAGLAGRHVSAGDGKSRPSYSRYSVLVFGVGLAALQPHLSRPVVRRNSLIGMSVRRRRRRTVALVSELRPPPPFSVERGQTLSRAVHDNPYGTAYIETMLTVGEMTGKYDDALTAIALYYDSRLRRWAAGMQRWLGPFVLILVGVFMAFTVFSALAAARYGIFRRYFLKGVLS